ncbi:MAG: hypothetical protein ABJF01_05695 [bacterium]
MPTDTNLADYYRARALEYEQVYEKPERQTGIPGSHAYVILKRFEQPDEVRELVKGRFEVVERPLLLMSALRPTFYRSFADSGQTTIHRETQQCVTTNRIPSTAPISLF